MTVKVTTIDAMQTLRVVVQERLNTTGSVEDENEFQLPFKLPCYPRVRVEVFTYYDFQL